MDMLLKIREDLHAAPLHPEKWAGILDDLAEITDSKGSALLIERGDGWIGWRISNSLEPQLSYHILGHRETKNTIISNWVKKIMPEEFITEDMVFGKNVWMETPFMRDYGIPNSINHVIGTQIYLPTGETALICSLRENGKPAYGVEERNKLNELRPYLMRAVLLISSIGTSKLDRLLNYSSKNQSLAIVLDSTGRVLKYRENNYAMSKFFVRQGSKPLKIKNPNNEINLEKLLAEVIAEKAPKFIPIKSGDESVAMLNLLPVESVFLNMFDMNNTAAATFEHTYVIAYISELMQAKPFDLASLKDI
jgi:hypothetical protein